MGFLRNGGNSLLFKRDQHYLFVDGLCQPSIQFVAYLRSYTVGPLDSRSPLTIPVFTGTGFAGMTGLRLKAFKLNCVSASGFRLLRGYAPFISEVK